MSKLVKNALIAITVCFCGVRAFAHCEIPCGIYDDKARVALMLEHCRTIEKSMREIKTLEVGKPINENQLVRWIMNKEAHADKLQVIVCQYFMTQRVKAVPPEDEKAYDRYVKQITLLHQTLVAAMKCKQTTDTANVDKLRGLIKQFETSYFHEHSH